MYIRGECDYPTGKVWSEACAIHNVQSLYLGYSQFVGTTKHHNDVSSLSGCRDFSVAPVDVK